MKTILCALMVLPLGLASAAPAVQVATIHTLNGRTYRQCKILQRDPDGIAFSHQKGTARVLYADLPASTRYELGYNAQAAAELERSRAQARQEKLETQRKQQKRAAERLQAARLERIRQVSLWNQAMMGLYYQGGGYAPFAGPVPAVGFAAPGWGGYRYGYGSGSRHHPYRRAVGWENVGNGGIVPGTGGIYQRQSGGFIFTGLPQIRYSPTLGYYNPGVYAQPPVPSLGTFNVVPGLGPLPPAAPAVVPGAHIHGSVGLPAGR